MKGEEKNEWRKDKMKFQQPTEKQFIWQYRNTTAYFFLLNNWITNSHFCPQINESLSQELTFVEALTANNEKEQTNKKIPTATTPPPPQVDFYLLLTK